MAQLCGMNLYTELFRQPWMIDETFAIQMMPHIQSLLTAGKLSEAFNTTYGRPYLIASGETAIGVVPITSVITKYDNCGMMGLYEIDALLQDWANDPKISAVILKADTPGGSAGYLPNIAQTISNYPKPIVTHFSGLLASAGYYLGSQTGYIVASTDTDTSGSIGTMLSFEAPNPDKTDSDTVIHTIYATKSTEKNQEFNAATKGQYDLVRKNILDPFNETFHAAVLSGRPGIDKEALKGATYMAREAITKGLIDAIMPWNEFVQFFSENLSNPDMAWNQNRASQTAKIPNNITMNKHAKLSAILGREVTDATALTAADMALVEAALPSADGGGQQPAPAAGITKEDVAASVTAAVSAGLQPIQTELTSMKQRLEVVEKKPAADPAANPAVDGGEPAAKNAWDDPENPINKAASAALGLA